MITPEIETFLSAIEKAAGSPSVATMIALEKNGVYKGFLKVETTRKAIGQIRELLSHVSVVTDHPYDPMGTYDGTCTHMLPVEPPQGMIAWVQCGAEQYAHIDLDAL